MAVETAPTGHITAAAEPAAVRFRAAGWTALGFSVLLNVASMAVPAVTDHPLTTGRGEIRMYLDVLEEGNLPTWWSTALLVVAAVAFALVGLLSRAERTRGRWSWFACAVTLAALSLDDHTSLHERLDRVGAELVTYETFPFYWLLPGLFVGVVIAAAFVTLAVHLRGAARWCMVGGSGLLLGSALGGELLQGLLLADRNTGPLYVLTYHAEELGENLGVLLLVAAAVQSITVTRESGRLVVVAKWQRSTRRHHAPASAASLSRHGPGTAR